MAHHIILTLILSVRKEYHQLLYKIYVYYQYNTLHIRPYMVQYICKEVIEMSKKKKARNQKICLADKIMIFLALIQIVLTIISIVL